MISTTFCVAMLLTQTASAQPFPAPNTLPTQPGLPNPLVAFDGKTVTTVREWETKRRPELQALFEHYMYGKMPAAPASVKGVELHRNDKAFDGQVVLKEIELQFDMNGVQNPLPIRMLLATPPGPGPFPCFVGISFAGNHALAPDEGIRIPDSW